MLERRPFPDHVFEDFRELHLGDLIGEGVSRSVYEHAMWPDQYVVKVETGRPYYFQNVLEYNTWTMAKYDPELADWLCPIVAISRSGRVLIMRRALPIRTGELPKKVPGFLVDLKPENWGILDGKPVATDYGWAPHIPGDHAKLRKAEWQSNA